MILGLTGKMGAGKDTAADRLEVASELPIVRISYARKLKESVAALFGITLEQIEEWKNDPAVVVTITTRGNHPRASHAQLTFRSMLQNFGTEAHRDVFGEDFWLDAALPLDGYYDRDTTYVITDVRFPNEAQRIRDLGGMLIRIEGPNTDTGSHASEQLELAYDVLIDNTVRDDDFRSLDRQLVNLMRRRVAA